MTNDGATETMPHDGSPRSRRPLGAVIRVVGANPPLSYRLIAGTCSVGTSPASDLVIDDPSVSRNHVELDLRSEGVAVRDMGSGNGTFYLGQRVEKMTVALGTQLTIGRSTIAIDADTSGLEENLDLDRTEYGGILGETPPMRRMFGLLARLEG